MYISLVYSFVVHTPLHSPLHSIYTVFCSYCFFLFPPFSVILSFGFIMITPTTGASDKLTAARQTPEEHNHPGRLDLEPRAMRLGG